MKIVVGISGGVDSSVAALLLKEAGHNVTGVCMKIWDNKCSSSNIKKHTCFGPGEDEDIKDAKAVCDTIGIPFYTFDCTIQYRDIVLTYFKDEYLSGRTPNPCVKCNHLMKFGVLPDCVRKKGIAFDMFATGHYVRTEYDKDSKRFLLKKARDRRKDQSYFLYRLSQQQLSTVMFPLGTYLKDHVRDIAQKKGLVVFDKVDSQNFYNGDYTELLDVAEMEGSIIEKNGEVLGKHQGIWKYTLGQRHGLGISSSKPLYVIGLNDERNEVVVGLEEKIFNDTLIAQDMNWIMFDALHKEMDVAAKIRSTHQEVRAIIKRIENDAVLVKFKNPQRSIAPGQSIVFYDGDIVIGGGIIYG